jgi:hypothetical protein
MRGVRREVRPDYTPSFARIWRLHGERYACGAKIRIGCHVTKLQSSLCFGAEPVLSRQRGGRAGPRFETSRASEGEHFMDLTTYLPYIVQAVGGAVGGNILGAVTKGGGGVVGRTVIGAIGGVAAGWAGGNVEAVSGVTSMWSNLIDGENGAHLANLITGSIGGGVLGLVGGLLIRGRD